MIQVYFNRLRFASVLLVSGITLVGANCTAPARQLVVYRVTSTQDVLVEELQRKILDFGYAVQKRGERDGDCRDSTAKWTQFGKSLAGPRERSTIMLTTERCSATDSKLRIGVRLYAPKPTPESGRAEVRAVETMLDSVLLRFVSPSAITVVRDSA